MDTNNRKRRLDQADGPFFRCTVCPYATHDSFDFYQHTYTIHGAISNKYPWFGCPMNGCFYTVSNLNLFSDHRSHAHPEIKDGYWGITSRFNVKEVIYCPRCRCAPFTNAYLFYAHVRESHWTEYKWDFKYGCTNCAGITPTCTGTCTLNWTRRVPAQNHFTIPNLGIFLRNNNGTQAMNDIDMD
ncbi:hypothetical protein PRIPAC_97468 [Pristionchus pacificus]|uniref:Uncharacterized protein n=1 Tax=Pristionchus pacificus TaxID=54126 RepID=A0A2A6BCN8_PRIPA|nr:hypothetical protein PRIPAC_97468 [Pristionchus pacificus]|eukprot:PDM63638.1 hypothetical protein PRIPAC_49611 [Pristionchus pacificus]